MKIINENSFDINKFRESKLVVNCKTKEDAKIFLEMLNTDFNINWDTNRTSSYKNKVGKYDTYWNLSFEKTVYRWHKNQILTYDNIEYLKGLKLEIVEFKSLNNSEMRNMLKKINWEDFINGEFAIHCKSENEVNELLQWIYEFNEENKIVNSPLAILGEGWGTEKEDICYYVNYGYINYCEKSYCNGTILEWNNKYEYYINGIRETELSEDKFNNKFLESIDAEFILKDKKHNNSEVKTMKCNIQNNNITWNAFMIEDIVIHCKTEKETEELLCWILQNKNEMLRSPISSFADGWYTYKSDVCFEFDLKDNMICYGNKKFYNSESYKILEWSGKNLYEINGTIEIDMDIDELNDKFIDFIESINGEFAGGIK